MLFYLNTFSSVQEALVYLLSLAIASLIAISFHEWGHAFVAYKLGDPTAKNLGRMSLDPTKHIDPIGFLCFLLLGIGWAKPVVINSRNLKHYRRDDILISVAGITMNIILSFVFYIIYQTLAYNGLMNEIVMRILALTIRLNITFAVFNLLPVPPLDGFHIVSSIFVRKNFRVVEFLQRFGFIILIALLYFNALDWLFNGVYNGLLSLYGAFFSLFI